jgi:hypothetical protein
VPTESDATAFAVDTGSVAVDLAQIPNQPIQFWVLTNMKKFRILYFIVYLIFFYVNRQIP